MSLGAEPEAVNALKVKWFYAGGTSEYVGLVRKNTEYTREQRDLPTTGLGVIYYSGLLRGKFVVVIAYTTGEVGNSVPQNFDEFIKSAAATGEVPVTAFQFKLTDRQGAPVTKIHTLNAKCVRYTAFDAAGEGETVAELEFIIIDASPLVA